MNSPPKKPCPLCDTKVVILPNGDMEQHSGYIGQIHWVFCPGAGKTVAQAERMRRRNSKKEIK